MRISAGALLALSLWAGVALAEPDPKDVEIHRQKGEILQLNRQVSQLQRARAALESRLALAETRLGLRPFRPVVLKPGKASWRLEPGKVKRIEAAGDRPRTADLRKVLRHVPAYVIAYWATWCKPCTTPEEIAALRRLEEDLERFGRPLLGVAVDGLEKVRRHPRAPDWFYPIWQREDAHIDWLPERFIKSSGLGLPLFVVVSGEGELLYWHNSTLNPAVHEEILTAAARGRR